MGAATLVVPFDGSDLAETAPVRAAEFATVFDEDVVAVAVIPDGNVSYARKRGWIGPDEAFDRESVIAGLHDRVHEPYPGADFHHGE